MNKRGVGQWMGTAFIAALASAIIVLAISGADEKGVHAALRVTARLSYVFFWPAYTASAITALFGPAFKPLAKRGREFGLAFASAHLIHVCLVGWLYRISAQPPVSDQAFVFFGIGIVWTYVLALFSIERLSRLLGPKNWRLVRTVGLEYIAFAFAFDFIVPIRGDLTHLVAYLPFETLAIAGWFLRISALILGQHRARNVAS
jgi:hypothetical protein